MLFPRTTPSPETLIFLNPSNMRNTVYWLTIIARSSPLALDQLVRNPKLIPTPILSDAFNNQAGIFMYMAEMRTVTTLFVKLDSYSPEKHKNLLSLQV